MENMYKSRYLSAIKLLVQSIGHNAYIFIVKDSGHMAFSDRALAKYASFFSFGNFGTGSIDGFLVTEIVNTYFLEFFNKYLKGKPSQLLDGEIQRYAEIEILYK